MMVHVNMLKILDGVTVMRVFLTVLVNVVAMRLLMNAASVVAMGHHLSVGMEMLSAMIQNVRMNLPLTCLFHLVM